MKQDPIETDEERDQRIAELVAAGGAICELCGQRMLRSDGCACEEVLCDGKVYSRIRYGDEQHEWGSERCHDCGAAVGHFHHLNCDVEECPACGGQLIGCDCDIEYAD